MDFLFLNIFIELKTQEKQQTKNKKELKWNNNNNTPMIILLNWWDWDSCSTQLGLLEQPCAIGMGPMDLDTLDVVRRASIN